jgi:hypothetical protein
MENEIDILKAQIAALKELVAIKDQLIATEKARATQYIYVQGPTQYVPTPYNPYVTWITCGSGGAQGGVNIPLGSAGISTSGYVTTTDLSLDGMTQTTGLNLVK